MSKPNPNPTPTQMAMKASALSLMSGAGNLIEWNPVRLQKYDVRPQTLMRIKRDLKEFYEDTMPQIHVVSDEEDLTQVHALVEGPDGTPYEKGFFYFYLRFPSEYPIKPPRVLLYTTDGQKVRFNPNLYNNGKVCLSILGTWSGPAWSPAMTLKTVLLSIQSLMCDQPFYNEPGYERLKGSKVDARSVAYNANIEHETLRVAVIGMMEMTGDSKNMPQPLKDVMINRFKENYHAYAKMATSRLASTGVLNDPFGAHSGKSSFNYSKLLERLKALQVKYMINDECNAGASTSSANQSVLVSKSTLYDAISSKWTEPEPKKPEDNLHVEDIIDDVDYFLCDDEDDDKEHEEQLDASSMSSEFSDDGHGKDGVLEQALDLEEEETREKKRKLVTNKMKPNGVVDLVDSVDDDDCMIVGFSSGQTTDSNTHTSEEGGSSSSGTSSSISH